MGDHDGGKFLVIPKILLCLVRIYEIANIAHLNYYITFLKDTALQHNINGLKRINDGASLLSRRWTKNLALILLEKLQQRMRH